jgi:pimeloyl-ACP methyl ester carboxylesterase
VEPFGENLLVLPLWWGGVQPLDQRSRAIFEMQNRREAVFRFTPGALAIRGHGELDGAYRKLDSELAPLELLLAGKNAAAYRGFRKLGLDDQAILQLVQECVVNLPSRREELYSFVKYLIDQGLKTPGVYRLASFVAVAVGNRAAAKAWCEQLLREKSDDAGALSTMRKMGHIATSGGWQLPFPLADAFRAPTLAELERVRSEWKSRDLKPRDIRREHEAQLSIKGVGFKATAISYLVHGQRNFGVILVPLSIKGARIPVLVELKGVSTSYEPLIVPQGILTSSILGADLERFVVFLPAVRGERLLFDGKTYQAEGDPDDSWDGATDDAISFISAGLDSCPQANANRLVVFGKSRGGAVAMLLGERDPRVRAIVSWSGPVGWIENMPQFGWSEFEIVREGVSRKLPPTYTSGQAIRTFFKRAIEGKANLEQTRDRLIASSPIYFLSQLPPAQLHYGVNDYDVPIAEGKSVEAAVERLGSKKPTVSIIYDADGGHDLNPKICVPTTKSFLLKYADVEGNG